MTFKEIKKFATELGIDIGVTVMANNGTTRLVVGIPARIPGCKNFMRGHTFHDNKTVSEGELTYYTTELIRDILKHMNSRTPSSEKKP